MVTKQKTRGSPRKPKPRGGQTKPTYKCLHTANKMRRAITVATRERSEWTTGFLHCFTIFAALMSSQVFSESFTGLPRLDPLTSPESAGRRRRWRRCSRECCNCAPSPEQETNRAPSPDENQKPLRWPVRYPERRRIRVLDLCCGTKSTLKALKTLLDPDLLPKKRKNRQRFIFVSLDKDEQWEPHILGNVSKWKSLLKAAGERDKQNYAEPGYWDIIWASPPCSKFSIAKNYATPDELEKARRHVKSCMNAIKELKPRAWFLENSRNVLRVDPMMQGFGTMYEVSYCHYSMPYRKHTCIWSNLPDLVLAKCDKETPCHWRANGWKLHPRHAQVGPNKNRRTGLPRKVLYRVPQGLMRILLGRALVHAFPFW